MNTHDYNALFASLNQAIELLHQHRTPDPSYIAAFDTLKQSRAMLLSAVQAADATKADSAELVAA